MPSLSVVASAMAFGSVASLFSASANQAEKSAKGSSAPVKSGKVNSLNITLPQHTNAKGTRLPTDSHHQASHVFYIRTGTARRNASDLALRSYSLASLHRLLCRFPIRAARILVCLGALGGCSVSMPMASLIPKPHGDAAGSLAQSKFVGWLDSDDWKHAKTALSRALDAEETGTTTSWDNPSSGARGTFVAVGRAYPGSDGLCRAFHADIGPPAADHTVDGTACAGKAGEWQVTEIKPSTKG